MKNKYSKNKTIRRNPKVSNGILDNEMEYFANRISHRKSQSNTTRCHDDNPYILPSKSIKFIKSLLFHKRGTKINANAQCAMCGSFTSSHWSYKIDKDKHLLLCNHCKQKVKPSSVISSLIYNNVESNKSKH